MEQEDAKAPARRRNILATLKGLIVTLVILAGLWAAMSYVLSPMLLGKGTVNAPQEAEAPTQGYAERIQALERRTGEIENTISALIESYDLRFKGLQESIEAVPAGASVDAPAIDNAELASLKADIEKLKAADHKTLRGILLTQRLGQAVRSGSPYAPELAAIRQLRGESSAISALEAESATGIATLAQLQEQFASAIHATQAPDGEEKSLKSNLRSLIKIRKVGAAQKGEDDDAIIARAEAKLKEGNIAAALAEIENLSGLTAQHFAAWKNRATAHLEAQASLTRLEAEIGNGVSE